MKKYIAELIGTFALVFIGAGAGAYNNLTGGSIGLVSVALAHGLILMGMIYALGHISGVHVNPAVTIALKITGKITTVDTIGYIVAQLIGAAIAGLLLKWIYVSDMLTGHYGATTLAAQFPPMKAVVLEGLGTFLFFTVIFGAAVDGRTAGNLVGVAIGLTLAGLILAIGSWTGGSFNPARSFGPALASNHWNHFWVYLVGPIVGGSLAGIVQTKFFMKS